MDQKKKEVGAANCQSFFFFFLCEFPSPRLEIKFNFQIIKKKKKESGS